MKLFIPIGRTVNRIGGRLAKRSQTRSFGALFAVLAGSTLLAGSVMNASADKLAVASVTASADDGNIPANTLDGALATRWSASGDGQWIRFDLGASKTIGSVRVAWYQGDQRYSTFDVQVSDNATDWTTVFSGRSSGNSTALETFDVTDSTKRYVRLLGHGNSANGWNSVSEVEVYDAATSVPTATSPSKLSIAAAKISSGQRITLTWPGTNGTVSQVQASTDLRNWQSIGSPITNTTASVTWTEDVSPASLPKRFYRVKHTPGSTLPPVTNIPLPSISKVYAKVQMGAKKMACYINRPSLDVYDPRVTRAIIVMHGAGANASAYFDRINNIIPSSMSDKVLVIAPYFQGDGTTVPSGEWGWPDDDWREAGASGGISSFTVLDNFVELLRNHGTFPNLKWIIVGGHSAGGQTAQRYAAFTDVDEKPWPNAPFMKFVVANPSSYFYLNQYRNPEGDSTWTVPSSDCTDGRGYNEWKYGLDGLYGYTAARGPAFARAHMASRQVELLAGTADTYDNGDLDLDCGAMWQGPHRYARAHIFKMFMDKYYPVNNLRITDVPGIAHDSTAMFGSTQGKNAFFFAD